MDERTFFTEDRLDARRLLTELFWLERTARAELFAELITAFRELRCSEVTLLLLDLDEFESSLD